jgi:hypothetical protein
MSTALRKLEHCTFKEYIVAASQSVTIGELVVLASDTTIQDAGGASDLGIGVATASATDGARVEVYLFGPIIPVAVGTGGATRGTKAKAAADGFTDASTHNSDGTGNESTYGIFMQTGTVGQVVGMMVAVGNRGV